MKVITNINAPRNQLNALYEIMNKVFSPLREPELKAILAQKRVDLNDKLVSATGVTYIHPPLYYATLAMNEPAIQHLLDSGAKYADLSFGELQQIKSKLQEEIKYLLNPDDVLTDFKKADQEIEVKLPKSVYGKLPEVRREGEILRRHKYVQLVDDYIALQKQVPSPTRLEGKKAISPPLTVLPHRQSRNNSLGI